MSSAGGPQMEQQDKDKDQDKDKKAGDASKKEMQRVNEQKPSLHEQ